MFSPFALHTVDKENFATRVIFTYLRRIWKKTLQNVNLLCWTALPAHNLRTTKGNFVKFDIYELFNDISRHFLIPVKVGQNIRHYMNTYVRF